jgi:hypothetical protein
MRLNVSPTPAQFVAEHGPVADWSAVDFEVHQNLAQVEQFEAGLLTEHRVVDAPSSVPLPAA